MNNSHTLWVENKIPEEEELLTFEKWVVIDNSWEKSYAMNWVEFYEENKKYFKGKIMMTVFIAY